jgi:large repetitive protein
MSARLLAGCCLVMLFSGISYSQTYSVSVNGFSGSGGFSPQTYSISGPFGTRTSSFGSFTGVPSVPTSFSITFFSSFNNSTCSRSGTVTSSSICGGSGSAGSTNGSCGGGGNSWGMNLSASPEISIVADSPAGTYCTDQTLTFRSTSGFGSYTWYYQLPPSASWIPFTTNSSTTYSFGIQEVFGASFAPYLNENIYFGYGIAGCSVGPNLTSSNVYVFSPRPIKANASTKTDITCVGANNGTLTVTGFDRPWLTGESIAATHLYTTNNPLASPVYSSNGSLTVTGVAPGSYYILLESSITPCLISKVFSDAPVVFSDPPALSASGTVTSDYNGSQINCPTATDGIITVNASGGTGALQYKLNSGAYQPINVFPNLGADTYTIGVKDNNGCVLSPSPTVTISPPSTVTISSSSKTDAKCNGGTGSITLGGGGGVGGGIPSNYQYSKDNGATYQTTNVFTGLLAGTYQMRVKDQNNCASAASSISITQPLAITFTNTTNANPTCFGVLDGSITINGASGGGSGLQFSKDGTNFQAGNSFGSLATGTYTLYAKDGNCPSITLTSVTLTQPSPVTISGTSFIEPSCFGGTNGSITVVAPEATQYSKDNGANFQASNVFTGISATTYSIVVKNATGCLSTTAFVNVTQPLAITGAITQSAFINCFGQSTASISVTPSGGTAPFNYTWSNGVTSQSNPNISAGTYNVTITDSKTCTGNASITVTQPAALVVTPSSSNISCKGGNNGSINLVVAGGTGVKTFLWSNGATAQNISGLASGSYSVTVTDANGCINNTTSVTITEPTTNVSVSLQSKTNVTCFGSSNGSILVTAAGGTGTLTYSRDGTNFQASANFTGLAPGNYIITARDANNCTQVTSTISISQPSAALSISGITRNNLLCNGNTNGSLVVSAAGGTAPYQYSIDGTNFSSSSTIGSLAAGNYLVTIKDANNCTIVSTTQSLVNPALLTATVTALPQSCASVVDGRLTVSASGGTGTLQYSIDGTNFQTGSVFNGLTAGSFTVTIKDANNCLITRPATVANVAPIAGTITQTAFINCFGQSNAALNLSISGGTAPFTYLWSNAAITQNISSLSVGSYSVNITDSKGCTGSASFTIAQPTLLTASTAVSNYNGFGVTCNGSSTGFINLTVAGGTSPFTYAWSNGATIKDIASLAAGTYSVTVTDSRGCTANTSATLTAPPVVSISLNSKTNVTCNGGTNGAIIVNASGGAGIFNYSIDGVNWQTSNSFGTLAQGSFTLRARDQNNCVSPAPLAVLITQPSIISISFTGFQNANCGAADGAVQAVASGGTGTLSYQWRDQSNTVVGNTALLSNVISGTYTVTVTDQSLCSKSSLTSVGSNGGAVFIVGSIVGVTCSASNDGKAQVTISSGQGPFTVTWGNGETGLSATQLSGGSNTVSVKDANNCAVASVFSIPSPTPISLSSITKTTPDCVGGNNGALQVITVGGTGPYTYQWNGTNGTNTLSGIVSGIYSLQIKDTQNCLFTQSIVLDDPLTIDIAVVNQVSPSCSSATDGSIQVLASGGSGGFSYSWNTGATSASITGLAAGMYTVTAKDSKNCTQPKSISLVAASPLSVSIVSSSMVSCFGGVNGSVTLSAAGGTGTYEYSVNGGSTWQTSTAFTNLTADLLDIRARDTNGCTGNNSFSITQPTALTSSIGSVTNTTCAQANGSATILGSGGTGPYTYQWLNSANQVVSSSNALQNAGAGLYQVVTTDARLCTTSNITTIAPSTNVSFNVTNVVATKCSTSSDGSAQVSVTSGKSPYTILWSSGETVTTATKLSAGTNTVAVKDADGCTLQQTFSVASPSAISLISETVFSPVCAGGNGSIQVTVAGGSSPYTYQWNGQSGTGFNQNIKAGNYQLIVTDANGCTFNKTFTVTDPAPYTIDLGPDKKICTGGVLAITSPVDASSYLWTSTNGFNNTGKQVILTQPGSYKLRVTNAVGCIVEDTFVLTTSSDLLKADFLMAPVAHVGDTVMAIDISWPLPDRIGWTFPQEATILVQSQDYASMIFKSEGKFPVKLTANLAECQSEYAASIEIIKRGETAGGSSSNNLIKSLTAFPNPTSENRINLKVELSEVAPVRVRLVSLEGNTIVTDFNADAKDLHEFEIRLDGVTKGVYFLLVDVRDQKRVVRIVVI